MIPARQVRAWVRKNPGYSALLSLALLSAFYWGVWASDRYESSAHLVIEKAEQTAVGGTYELTSLLGSASGTRDLYLLNDYLLSADMLALLDQRLKVRAHYADGRWDLFSRLSASASREDFLAYYRNRVSAEINDATGILTLRVQAYTPEMARAMAELLVAEGERFMNLIGQGMAGEQVKFIEEQAAQARTRADAARQRALDFQDRNRLASPEAAMAALSGAIAAMEQELSRLRAERRALATYLSPRAPDIVQLDARIQALEKQVVADRSRLAAPGGNTLNAVTEAYARLQLEAEFTQELYKSTVAALEKARVDSTRKLKYVAILQRPTMPEEALHPSRLYNFAIFIVAMLMLAGIFRLVQGIVREHQD